MLLNAGAAIDEAGDMGYTPLQYAIKQAVCLDTVLLFIQKGASFSIENEFGNTALFELIKTGLDLSDVCNTKWTNKTMLTQLEITYIEQSLGIEINVNSPENMKKALITSIKESNLVCFYAILKHGVNPLEPLSDSLCIEDEINKLINQMPFSVSNFDKVILSEKQSNSGHLTVEQKQILFWYSIFLNRRLWLLD